MAARVAIAPSEHPILNDDDCKKFHKVLHPIYTSHIWEPDGRREPMSCQRFLPDRCSWTHNLADSSIIRVYDGLPSRRYTPNKNVLVDAALLCPETIITAGGELPNTTLPAAISGSGIQEIQLAQFLENLEVSFFTVNSANIKKWDRGGYSNDSIEIVSKIAAQEEVHLQNLATLLNAYQAPLIPPCNYSFPVTSTKKFFQLAHLIGSEGIGAIIGLSERLATTDPMLARLVSSILTFESRHDAFIRHVQGDVPKPGPFDTGINNTWAYNIALSFIAPGSCPVEVPVPVLPRLTMAQQPSASYTNGTDSAMLHEFTWDPTQIPFIVKKGI
ncbi:hypothetical protein K469DRAFT_687464 [Zopfia rhizophila CBS 207.26]|uniref:Ferritin-like domain-containing protein n=1 Tax=Zopfia rhizophila CBS 207.26 TaxID=1314779 RepID=A0A6A6E649_9PEZI|nr:hypothetical protein K469DRAFT_687464 [Zopfia rhizophila CBS 207.26]